MEFKPLPKLGGSIEEIKARSQTAREISQKIQQDKSELAEKLKRETQEAETLGLLTPNQIKHWRSVLLGIIGPWALIMPSSDIQAIRDSMQKRFLSTLS